MGLLLQIMSFAAPFLIGMYLVSRYINEYDETHGVYAANGGLQRRDEINREFRVSLIARIIAYTCAALWGLVVSLVMEDWGFNFWSIVASALAVVPIAVIGISLLAAYLFSVHFYANYVRNKF